MKNKFNIKNWTVLPVLVLLFASCNNFGKKITVEGTKGEVFYKGEGVTESDAKKAGDYLKKVLFSNDKEASAQLLKDGDGYELKLVYVKGVYDTLTNADALFKTMGVEISKQAFGGKKVKISLTDDHFKDYKTFAYDEAAAKVQYAPEISTGIEGYDKQVADDITFYWKAPVTDAEAETIRRAIIATGEFKGGSAENTNIIMEKNGDRYYVKYPVADAYINDASTIAIIEAVSKKIKDAAFANMPYTFVVIDTKMNAVKNWDY